MKRILTTFVSILFLASCQNKVMFVDNSKLLNNYKEKQDLEAELQKKIDTYSKKRDSISMAFQMEAQNFEKKSKSLAPTIAQQKYSELMQKSQFLQEQLMREERMIQEESRTKMDTLLTKVKKFINNFGKEKGYTYILGANDGGSVLYGQDSQNITSEVVKALNENYKK